MNNNLLQPDSAKKNFIFQLTYQIVILVLPLVVSPYLTRTLGGLSLGVYTYTYSIAYYFVVFAMLGINKYGQRIISQRRGDLIVLRKTFWSLYVVHFCASLIALACYTVYVLFICKSDQNIALIQTIYVSSAIFDLTWLFCGLEKFKMVTVRNAIVRIVNTICIFVFVNSPSDIGIYTFVMALTFCMGNILLFPQVFSTIPPIHFSLKDIMEHMKPMLTLFTAAVAISLYTVFDKTLLGLLTTKENVAFYEYSDKIINIPKMFIGVVSTILYPKACKYALNKDKNGMKANFQNSLMVTCFIGFASFFGLLAIAKPFAIIYYGEEFSICGDVIITMCPLIIIIGIGEVLRMQYIYPLQMDVAMVKILTLNAIVNLIVSSFLIPKFGITGAVIGTFAAELLGLCIELWMVRKYFSLKLLAKGILPFAVCGGTMFGVIKIFSENIDSSMITLLLQVIGGAFLYCGLYILYCVMFDRAMLIYLRKTVKATFNVKIKR